ncbi:hypothetical protein CLOM_g12880 [Closterium sp. NIES-68]|nr:hypothetical protein CLOM_g12880 [Closterium sp. NIES-68]
MLASSRNAPSSHGASHAPSQQPFAAAAGSHDMLNQVSASLPQLSTSPVCVPRFICRPSRDSTDADLNAADEMTRADADVAMTWQWNALLERLE